MAFTVICIDIIPVEQDRALQNSSGTDASLWSLICRWGLLLPTTFVLATSITNLAFKDSVVLKGPCPNCGAENFTYFGQYSPGSRDRVQP